jgi:hypothetical protein
MAHLEDDPTILTLDWWPFTYCARALDKNERGECQYGPHKHLTNVYTLKRWKEHPTCPLTLEVGRDCAEKLCPGFGKRVDRYDREKRSWERSD